VLFDDGNCAIERPIGRSIVSDHKFGDRMGLFEDTLQLLHHVLGAIEGANRYRNR
jgi:hypothetical protein